MLRVIKQDIPLLQKIYNQTIKYYQGRLCSCIGANNGIPDPKCGCTLGFWYSEPEIIQGIRTNADFKYLKLPHGRVFEGGSQFTIPKSVRVGKVEKYQRAYDTIAHGDILVLDNKVRRDTDILCIGVRDKLLAFDVQEIISVSERSRIFVEGQDYELNGVEIKWIGNRPQEYYSVEFICKQQFKVWDNVPKDRGTDTENLPRLVVCVLRKYNSDEPTPLDSPQLSQELY